MITTLIICVENNSHEHAIYPDTSVDPFSEFSLAPSGNALIHNVGITALEPVSLEVGYFALGL
jgi:hypothetical protein